jgi:hypothetical protein
MMIVVRLTFFVWEFVSAATTIGEAIALAGAAFVGAGLLHSGDLTRGQSDAL